MFPPRRVIGGLIVTLFILAAFPSNKADILLPTIETCDTVQTNLLNWDSLTWDQMNWTAKTGNTCEDEYPLLYDAQPTSSGDDDEGETCDTYGSLNDYYTACAHAHARANAYLSSYCDADTRLTGQYCYFKYEYGEGSSQLRQTSGHVITKGMETRNAYWPHTDDPYAKTVRVEKYEWHYPGADCLIVETKTLVRVLLSAGVEIPGSGIIDSDSEVCS